MPPNCANGQAFVQDPKVRENFAFWSFWHSLSLQVAGTREIAAQIRLKFRNVKGEPFVVIRSMQLTQKSTGKLEFKSKEGTIQMVRNKQVRKQESPQQKIVYKLCSDSLNLIAVRILTH